MRKGDRQIVCINVCVCLCAALTVYVIAAVRFCCCCYLIFFLCSFVVYVFKINKIVFQFKCGVRKGAMGEIVSVVVTESYQQNKNELFWICYSVHSADILTCNMAQFQQPYSMFPTNHTKHRLGDIRNTLVNKFVFNFARNKQQTNGKPIYSGAFWSSQCSSLCFLVRFRFSGGQFERVHHQRQRTPIALIR